MITKQFMNFLQELYLTEFCVNHATVSQSFVSFIHHYHNYFGLIIIIIVCKG